MEKITETFALEGLSCAHCVRTVRDALEAVDGTRVHSVDIGSARVTLDDEPGARERLVEAVETAGYRVA